MRRATRPASPRGIIGAVPPTLIVPTPDGRSLDVWLDGPADGEAFLFHHGTPGNGLPYGWHASIPGRVHLWQGGHDRMVPYAHGQWLAAHTGGACVHLSDDQGHLSLVRDRFGDMLDELLAPVS